MSFPPCAAATSLTSDIERPRPCRRPLGVKRALMGPANPTPSSLTVMRASASVAEVSICAVDFALRIAFSTISVTADVTYATSTLAMQAVSEWETTTRMPLRASIPST